jgi:integrase
VSRTKKPYTADGFRSVFRRACERAAVTNFRFHDTRHTTATRLRRANVGLDVVAKALGTRASA